MPGGVKISTGCVLGHYTQLCPGTVLNKDLCVVEWPRELMIPPRARRPAAVAVAPTLKSQSLDVALGPFKSRSSDERNLGLLAVDHVTGSMNDINSLGIGVNDLQGRGEGGVSPCVGLPRGLELVRMLPGRDCLPLGIGRASPAGVGPGDGSPTRPLAPYRR